MSVIFHLSYTENMITFERKHSKKWIFFSFIVPGCKKTWKAQSDFCFRVITNESLTKNEMKHYCRENGEVMRAVNKNSVRLVEQFLLMTQLNSETNSSQCLVIGHKNTSSYSTLPGSFALGPVSSIVTHTCAIREKDKWTMQLCNHSNCDDLCIAPRGTVFK